MKKTTKLPIRKIVIFLFILSSTTLLAQEDHDSKSLILQHADSSYTSLRHETHKSGYFSPDGPPSSPPKRIDVGRSCIVDLVQDYRVSGTLSGTFTIDYRIMVDGPCGSPLGTFNEDWIAHGTFSGKLNEEKLTSSFTYIAHVIAGGEVEGTMVFERGVTSELNVRGNFTDGKLFYESVASERYSGNMKYTDLAQQWFQGVYGSNPSVVEELAAKDVVISYPIFQKLFGKPVIHGLKAAKSFASGFSQRWKETKVIFHETIVQDRQVVLIWSFSGRNVGSARNDIKPTNEVHEWGGITLIRFDDKGKIVAEIGEESEPGPFDRLTIDSSDTQESLHDDRRIHFPIDHVAWIMDQETIDALAESPFLQNEFANSQSHKRQGSEEVGGFILFGLHTQYLEFRAEVLQKGLDVSPGDCMIAFNAEKEGSVDWIISKMSKMYPESKPTKSLKTFKRGKEIIPHSHVASFYYETGDEGFGAWVLELHQEFKNRMSGGRTAVGEITRKRFNPSVLHHPDKYFKDVLSITVAVSDVRRKDLVNLLTELGYEITQSNDMTVCTGKENVIELIPKTNQKYPIVQTRVSLMRPKEGETIYHFGPDIVLTFCDSLEAVWEFGGIR